MSAAGLAGFEWPSKGSSGANTPGPKAVTTTTEAFSAGSPQDDLSQVYRFFSRPDLQPPMVRTVALALGASYSDSADGHVLLTPKGYAGSGPGQAGLMILGRDGELRWFVPASKPPFDLQYQFYKGEPVLTWWEGDVVNGTGYGEAVIADMSFKQIARLSNIDGLQPDLHELNLTSEGTALVTAYHTVPADLTAVRGPKKGYAYGGVALEIELPSGKVVHRWETVEHVPIAESYQHFSGGTEKVPFDYFHINSIAVADDGDLLISGRNTWAVYKVDRATGAVKWRLNGKASDFKMGPGSRFYWQHHARQQSNGLLTLFDDGASPTEEEQSRALVLKLDEAAKTCTLERAFVHPSRLLAPNQGSMQLLEDGGALVGWGAEPYFSRFSGTGELLVDGRFPTNVESYRAFVAELKCTPDEKPAVVVGTNPPGGSSVYVSWNGSTEVQAWRVLTGPQPDKLALAASSGWEGFETAITIANGGPYFQAVALDRTGREIGRSEVVKAA